MARDVVDLTPIESRDELVAWFAEGAKPKAQWRAGTEHEKFAFTADTNEPVPYEGRRSIRSLLVGMQHLLGWEPITDKENIIGLADVTGGGAISLEPGGQFELSGAPLRLRLRAFGEPRNQLVARFDWRQVDNVTGHLRIVRRKGRDLTRGRRKSNAAGI